MINVYDIILNLLDSDRIYEPFEWSSEDNIEHIKKIPMIRVSSKTLTDIINTTFTINNDLLEKIYKKTQIYDDKSTLLDYVCLFTDESKVVAVEFSKNGKSIYKSYLLLDEEEEILDISTDMKETIINYKVLDKNENNNYLTRSEEIKRKYVLKEIKNSYKNKKYEKINYLYEEIYNKKCENIDQKYNDLIKDIDKNYCIAHNKIYNILRLINKKKTTSN